MTTPPDGVAVPSGQPMARHRTTAAESGPETPQGASIAGGNGTKVTGGCAARKRRRRIVRNVLSLAVVVVVFVGVIPQVADLGEVWRTIQDMTLLENTTLLVAAAWNILTYQFVMMAALPGLRLSDAFITGQLSTAIANTVPAGSVFGVGVTYSTLRSLGHDTGAIAMASGVAGVWNSFVKLGLPILVLALLALEGNAGSGLVTAAVVGLAVLVAAVAIGGAALSSERLATRIGDAAAGVVNRVRGLLRRAPVSGWGTRLATFQHDSVGLLRSRWHWLTLATIVSHLSLFVVLLVTLRHAGVGRELVSDAEVLGAFAFVRLATALPITPGGLGVVELGLTAALTVAGGPRTPVLAAVLVYRALTYALQLPLGAVSWTVLRRRVTVAT